MKKLHPRILSRSGFVSVLSLVALAAFFADRRATDLRYSRLSRGLESRLSEFEKRLDSLSSVQPSSASVDSSVPSPASDSPSLPDSRLEGVGRTGNWRYADIRLADGSRRRYYIRADASPFQYASWLDGISRDKAEASIYATSLYLSPMSAD